MEKARNGERRLYFIMITIDLKNRGIHIIVKHTYSYPPLILNALGSSPEYYVLGAPFRRH